MSESQPPSSPSHGPTSSDEPTSSSAEQTLLPAGFRFAGVPCGVKPSGRPDLSLIVSDRPVSAAAVTTQNQIVAAPVLLCRERTPSSSIRAVVTVSGNANACTGEQGHRDAVQMGRWTADHAGCDEADVLVMSTGIIGQFLPMDRVSTGIQSGFAALDDSRDSFLAAADAIRTTDHDRKVASTTVDLEGAEYRIAAMAKGAGMIAPNMATFLCVFLTDAPLDSRAAHQVLEQVVATSFNRCSVDGHTSTNDTCLLLASGDTRKTTLSESALADFGSALNQTAVALSKQIVADGEGASHYMALRVIGAASDADAETVARTVAASPLVKTALTGNDPNWGRIVSAAGYADAPMTPARIGLSICGVEIYRDGTPILFDAAELSKTMGQKVEIPVELRIGDGEGTAEYWSSDLTVDYVRFNSEYTT